MDIAFIDQDSFWPVEIKWTGQIRPKDLAQVMKYPNDIIWSKGLRPGLLQGKPLVPIPLGLFRLDS